MSAHHELQTLWSDLSEQAPSGQDLEYDAEFLALERAAASRGERVVGDSVIAAEAPDWERVRDLALALQQRTRDLRVAVHLTRAWTCLQGLEGWGDGLALLRGLLEQQWASVHPQLDAEDDDDPTARVNALLALADPQDALALLRGASFVRSPRLGRFSLRDLRMADGTLKPSQEGDAVPTRVEIEACCLDCPVEELEATAATVRRALEDARAIDALLGERLGAAGPDLKALLGDLGELDRFVQSQWQARGGQGDALAGAAAGTAAAGGTPAASAATAGQIAGPEDVRRRLDEICDYYARHEPSSPLPLLLKRARRLVGCDFMVLLRDLAPSGVDELERVAGRSDEG